MYTVLSTDGLQDRQLVSVLYGMFPIEDITALFDTPGIDRIGIISEGRSTGLADTITALTMAIAIEITQDGPKCIEMIDV